MPRQSRNNAYAAIQISWLAMRPDLRFELKEVIRDERLCWITSFLGLRRPLGSITELSDKQLGFVIEEMKRLSGQAVSTKKAESTTEFKKLYNSNFSNNVADVVHLAGEAQLFTINKLVGAIGWTEEGFRDFLFQKFRRRSPRMLTFKQANSLTMILLNIAADKHLRAQGKTKITRKMTAEYIPTLKRKLEIDR